MLEEKEELHTSPEHQDPLLDCLVYLTHFYHHSYSRDALRAGLPMNGSQISPQLFVRAAERAGLSAKIINRKLHKIHKLVLPVVLILHNQCACILNKINPDKSFEILFPDHDNAVITKTQAELEDEYSGYAIFIKPMLHKEYLQEEHKAPTSNWFWGTLLKYKKNYLEVILAAFFVNLFALVSPLFVMNVYDRVVPNNAVVTLWVLSIGVFIIYVFDIILRLLRGYLVDICSKKADTVMAGYLFAQIMDLELVNKPKSVGEFINNIREFETIREFFTSASLITLIDLPFLVLYLTLIWYLGGIIVLVPLTSIPLILLFALAMEAPIRNRMNRITASSAKKNAILVESVSSLETVKTQVSEGVLQKKWEQQISEISRDSLKSRFLSSILTNFSYLIQQLNYVITVIVGVYLVEAQQFTLGGLIACTILSGRILAPLTQLTGMVGRYQQAKIALNDLNKFMNLETEHPINKHYIHHKKFTGAFEFSKVSFQYPGQNGWAIEEMSFSVKAGEKVGIMGRLGSGKSTLEKLVLNLYHPQQGLIYFDSIDSKHIDPVDIRKNIGYVPQDGQLFSGTLKENIILGQPWATDDAILNAAQLAGLDRVINKHPLGFDMPVSERGESFSGGQRQAITIARALLNNPNILLFDEPTSSMDVTSEQELIARLQNFFKEKTLLLVTHRPSLLALVDRIIILENGKIIMDGPKEQIIKSLTPQAPKPAQGARWA